MIRCCVLANMVDQIPVVNVSSFLLFLFGNHGRMVKILIKVRIIYTQSSTYRNQMNMVIFEELLGPRNPKSRTVLMLFHSVQSFLQARNQQALELHFRCYHSSWYFLTLNLYGLYHKSAKILLQFQFNKLVLLLSIPLIWIFLIRCNRTNLLLTYIPILCNSIHYSQTNQSVHKYLDVSWFLILRFLFFIGIFRSVSYLFLKLF